MVHQHTRSVTEPDLLKRLRKAIQISGLTVDLSALSPQEQAIVVTNRLAQTTVRYLTHEVDPVAGQRLSEELRTLAGPEEYELLMEGTGFTFFHVVQFLYEFAKTHARIPDPEHFCAGMGYGGGGVEVAPHTEVTSLIRLLITALPQENDRRHIGVLMQTLGPLFLGQIFTAGLFQIEIAPAGTDELRIDFQYADRTRVAVSLGKYGLADDIGTFFLNSALHIQGTVRLGWETFAQDAERTIDMEGLIDRTNRERIAGACACTWRVNWKPSVRLNRLGEEAEILNQAQTIYEALNRKDLEYYLERIKSLETRVQALEQGDRFHALIGKSPEMRRVYEIIQQVATTDLTVLIRGESGTGKELVARAIHESSARKDRPFVPMNCAAFSESLLESELFGHEKGAFTGADHEKPGRFELADGGTLFLDEVGDIPQTTQIKLLRVLETQAFERVGGTQTIQTDVRILGATNRNLEELIAGGTFREDFFYRLNVLPINLPPLRTHQEDIPNLAQHFLERSAQRSEKDVGGLSRGALSRLARHTWPGNIRELQNIMERAVVVYARGPTVTEIHIVQALGFDELSEPSGMLNVRQQQILQTIVWAEGSTVDELMERLASKDSGSACSRRTLQYDLRKLAEFDYVNWYKQGSARCYAVTSQGKTWLQQHAQ